MKKIIILSSIILFFLPNLVLADFDISVDVQDSFSEGETSFFSYLISSDTNQTITFVPYITCPNAPLPFIEYETFELKAGESYEDTYYGITIDEFIEPQTCTAYIQILEPFQQKVEKEFKIITDPSFEFRVLICKDAGCQEMSKVYQVGERFYLDYESEIDNPEVSVQITKPSGVSVGVLRATPVLLDEAGIYILEATASKQGYKTMKDTNEIKVVEEFVEPIDTRLCNVNDICEPDKGEDEKNCPQDCLVSEIEKAKLISRKILSYIFVNIGIVIVIVIVGYFYYRRRRKFSNHE